MNLYQIQVKGQTVQLIKIQYFTNMQLCRNWKMRQRNIRYRFLHLMRNMNFRVEKNAGPIFKCIRFSTCNSFAYEHICSQLTDQYRQFICSNLTEKLLFMECSIYLIKSGSPPPASSICVHTFLELEFGRHFEQHAIQHKTCTLYIHRKFNAEKNWAVNCKP